jgi:hypothetical protein
VSVPAQVVAKPPVPTKPGFRLMRSRGMCALELRPVFALEAESMNDWMTQELECGSVFLWL